MKVRLILRTHKIHLSLRKYFLQKPLQPNVGHLLSLYFSFAADEVFFDQFIWLHNERRNANSFVLVYTKQNQPRDKSVILPPSTGKVRETQTLIQNFWIGISNSNLNQIGFLLLRMWKYFSKSSSRKEEKMLIDCGEFLPWNSS